MAKGIFPSMSIPDIIGALAGWGLSVSHEQLVRPSSDFVEGVYCACLQQVTDITHESLRDPVQNALSAADVDRVRRAFALCILILTCNSLGPVCFRPDPQRHSSPPVCIFFSVEAHLQFIS
jgi:Nuf2 family